MADGTGPGEHEPSPAEGDDQGEPAAPSASSNVAHNRDDPVAPRGLRPSTAVAAVLFALAAGLYAFVAPDPPDRAPAPGSSPQAPLPVVVVTTTAPPAGPPPDTSSSSVPKPDAGPVATDPPATTSTGAPASASTRAVPSNPSEGTGLPTTTSTTSAPVAGDDAAPTTVPVTIEPATIAPATTAPLNTVADPALAGASDPAGG